MKRKTKLLLIGVSLIICLCGVLLFVIQNDSTEEIIYTVVNESFERGTPTKTPKKLRPKKLHDFLDAYLPIIADASPEVQAVMKQFDPKFRKHGGYLEIERFLPADEWLQKLLGMGIVIDDFSDYSGWLNHRSRYWLAHNNPESLISMKDRLNLNADTSWDDVVEAGIWSHVKLKTLADEAMEADPLVEGGTLGKDGVFIPFRINTIYIQTYDSNVISSQKGAGVPDWVPQELHHRAAGIPPKREIPKHVEVVFLDDAGKPVEEKIAQSRAQRFQLEPYLIKGAEPVNASEIESVDRDRDTSIGEDSDIVRETDTDASDMTNRSQPDADFNIDEIPDENNLDASLTPKLPTDMPIESDFERRLNEAERMLDDPKSEDDLRRLKQIDPDAANEKEHGQHAPPVDDEQK